MNWLSVAEISRITRIPAPTARRYASLFKDFLPGKKIGRVTKYPEDVVQIFERISALYGDGKVTAEIEEILRQDFSRTIDVSVSAGGEDEAHTSPAEAAYPAGPSPVELSRSLSDIMDKFGTTLDVIADQKNFIEAQQDDIRKLKTAFVLLARSQKKQRALPAGVNAISDPHSEKIKLLEAENASLKERLGRLEAFIAEKFDE